MPPTKDIDIDSLLEESGNGLSKGHGIRSLGPSDSSDSGSDMAGVGGPDSTSDRHGTGERASVESDGDPDSPGDIAPDSIVNAEEAGLGGGLDQAEEAQLGVTDEEISAALRRQAGLPES
jgi:hypothetical protein